MRLPHSAEELESYLGDPRSPQARISFQGSVELDEADAYPEAAVRALGEWRYLEHFVPVTAGGKLERFDHGIRLLQAVSRRDLTAAIALGQSFLGSVAVWIAGTEAQRARMSELLRRNGQAALALTEEAHGSDILANEVSAERTPTGFVLRGQKWLINNATRGEVLSVFARTDGSGGLGGFSLFLVDKRKLPEGSFEPLPKKRTHGIRGADISGIRFEDAPLEPEALVGSFGGGAELALKGLQITRVGCAGFSLGAGDTALRLALDFAAARRLYGGTVLEIPHAKSTLLGVFLDQLLCDAVMLVAARAIHVAPEQLSLISAITKYFVPTRVDRAIREAALVLGARHYVREGFAEGAFQKLLRDSAVVSLFDGSTAVNLEGIGLQLPRLASQRARGANVDAELSRALFDLDAPLPAFELSRLQLMNGGEDLVTQGMPVALELLDAAAPEAPQVLASVREEAHALWRLFESEEAQLVERARDRSAMKRSPELFAHAHRFSLLWAGAAALQLWLHSRQGGDTWFRRGEWLALVLARLRAELEGGGVSPRHPLEPVVTEAMLALHRDHQLFALQPLALARGVQS
ncbi:MAG: acyl-CoA dehydrogenase [Myxococcaceae bacterium]